MDERTKVKAITTIICLLFSVFALYTFIFVIDVSKSWKVVLILIAFSWIISGINTLAECFGKRK